MDITHTKYIIQDYVTENTWPGNPPAKEEDFGFWQDENGEYDTYEDAMNALAEFASHWPDLMRVVVRTTTVTTTENVLYRYTPEREAHEE